MLITVFTADFDTDEAGIVNLRSKEDLVSWSKDWYDLNEDEPGCPKVRCWWTIEKIVDELNAYDCFKSIRVLDFNEDFTINLSFTDFEGE